MRSPMHSAALTTASALLLATAGAAEDNPPPAQVEAPTSSLMALTTAPVRRDQPVSVSLGAAAPTRGETSALKGLSLFYVGPPDVPTFEVHDLIQIIVRESSSTESTQELEANKDFKLDGGIDAWPDLTLADLLNLQIPAGRTAAMPSLKLDFKDDFSGDGKYKREDDFTARVTAEVIEVKPNGNLVLEARTTIQTDKEVNTIQVTGVCRPDDVTISNTIYSNQIHDLIIHKMHEGELKKSNEKGLIARVLEFVFAF